MAGAAPGAWALGGAGGAGRWDTGGVGGRGRGGTSVEGGRGGGRVKVRGGRVEGGEVEAALGALRHLGGAGGRGEAGRMGACAGRGNAPEVRDALAALELGQNTLRFAQMIAQAADFSCITRNGLGRCIALSFEMGDGGGGLTGELLIAFFKRIPGTRFKISDLFLKFSQRCFFAF